MNQVTGRISERAGKMQSPKFGVISEVRKYIEGVADVIDLGYGGPDFETPSHTSPQCSFYVYANITGFGTSSVELTKRLARDARVLYCPSTASTSDESGGKYLSFAYTKSTDELIAAIERMKKLVETL